MRSARSGVQSEKAPSALSSASTAQAAISSATVRHCCSASGGVASRRSSSSACFSTRSCGPSGTSRMASFSSRPPQGSSMAVQMMLKQECAMAMPYMVALSWRIPGSKTALRMQNTVSSAATPMTLNIRCTTAARRAFLLAPTEDSSAVTQVPIFWPMMMGMAAA